RLAKRAASAAFEQPPDQQVSDVPEGGHGAEVGGAEHLPERALSVARREQRSLPLRQALGRRTALAGEDPVERRARLQALRPGLDPRGVQREQAPRPLLERAADGSVRWCELEAATIQRQHAVEGLFSAERPEGGVDEIAVAQR